MSCQNYPVDYKLAIIIPAYKSIFFKKALDSIANQTCLDFTLYIGNDNSPENLYSIVKEYESSLEIKYKHFDENFGGVNLVSHWERCIDLVQNEEWIWLFSDDDTMEERCVEKFYEYIKVNKTVNLLHFDINIINENGILLSKSENFPKNMPVETFFAKRVRAEIDSAVVEYIIRKEDFKRAGNFKNYDLAWSSDDATWIRLARENGIVTIPNTKVNWRQSGSNISSMSNDKKIAIRKLKSNIEHLSWVKNYFLKFSIKEKSTEFDKFKWAISVVSANPVFTFKEKMICTIEVIRKLKYFKIIPLTVVYSIYMQIKMEVKRRQV